MRSLLLAAALLVSATVSQAAVLSDGNIPPLGSEVIANGCTGNVTGPALTVSGCLNDNKNQFVLFTGTENLTYTGGQATLDAQDGQFSQVTITLDPTANLSKLILNIDMADDGIHGQSTGTVEFDVLNQMITDTLNENGNNFFTLTQIDATSVLIKTISPTLIEDIKQVRVTLADTHSVPEPASLALLGGGLLGLGLVRRRRTH